MSIRCLLGHRWAEREYGIVGYRIRRCYRCARDEVSYFGSWGRCGPTLWDESWKRSRGER